MLLILSLCLFGCRHSNEAKQEAMENTEEEVLQDSQPFEDVPIDSSTEIDTHTETESQTETETSDPCDEPQPICEGICALIEPVCTSQGWECTAPNREQVEISCDGRDIKLMIGKK